MWMEMEIGESQEPLWRGGRGEAGEGEGESDVEEGIKANRAKEKENDDDDNSDEKIKQDKPKPKAQETEEEAAPDEESHQVENLEILMTKMLAIRGIFLPPHLSLPSMFLPPLSPPSLLSPLLSLPSLFLAPSFSLSLTTTIKSVKDQSANMPEAEKRRFAARAVRGIMADL